LYQRLLSAACLIGSLLFLIVLDGWFSTPGVEGLWLLPAGAFFLGGTALEMAQMIQRRWPVRPWMIVGLTLVVFLSASVPMLYTLATGKPYPKNCPMGALGFPLLSCLAATGAFALVMMGSSVMDPDRTLATWALSSLIPLYVGVSGSFWIAIRQMHSPLWGLLALIGVIAVTKISDAGAYFVGKSFGKNKMCPLISPGKTVEGAVGGIAAGIAASVLWFALAMPIWTSTGPSWALALGAVLFGLILVLTGVFGDLVESVVKRSTQVKDSGQILPGLGGLWDVTDSLLPAAVAGYVGIVAGLVGKG
jgi:phosphatidate cytidylyltransferase